MLEQLGLGIVLSFQDNFTPQANNAINSMLKLETQAEQMTSNVQKSLNNLQNLMLSGFSLSQIGDEFQKAGKAITGFFGDAFKHIADASAKMETFKAQFKTVFGNEAQKKMDWAVDFAVKTPFELKDLISSMQKMGSQKIDVSKTFKNSQGQEKAFMEYMGDLATRNMDATGGVQGMGIAISNAWSGQLRSLEQRFDIAKQDLQGLKQYAGKDQAKFMEEFVKLADKYAPNAMKNLEGTWEQTMSNMDDAWFNMMFRLGDKDGGSDVFGSMKKSLNKVSELLFEVSSNSKMLGTMRSIFQDLWQPVDKLADVLVKAVRGIFAFAEAHPELTKFIAKFTAITGVVLIAVGAFMKLTGGVMIFTTSLVSAYANLKILKSLNLGGELASIARGFGLIGSLLSTSVLAVGALGLAYKFNIGGAREDVDKLIKTFKDANSYKEKLLNTDDRTMNKMFIERNDNLANKIGFAMAKFEAMKVVAVDAYNEIFKGHSDVLRLFTENHFEPVGFFGLKNFQKTMFGLFDGIKGFLESFKEGLGIAYNVTKQTIGYMIKPFVVLKDIISNAFGKTTTEGMNNFKEVLKDVGMIAGSVLGSLLGFKVVKGLTNILLSPFKALLGILGKVGRKAKDTFSKLNPMNWYNKSSLKNYESIVKTRGQVSGMTGKSYTEAQYKAMGLGLSRSQRRAGYISQKRALEQATGRHFSAKQLSAMGLEKPVNIFKATAKSFRDSINLLGGAIKSKSNLVDTRLSRDPNSKFRLANLDMKNQLDRELKHVFFAGKKGYSLDDSIEVKSRPKWMDTLLGQKFSSVNSSGHRTNLGSYGGVLTKRHDDNQMRLASQIVKPRGLDRSEFSNEKDYKAYLKSKVAPDQTTGLNFRNFFKHEGFNYDFREQAYDKVNKRLGDYIGRGAEGAGQFRKRKGMTDAEKMQLDLKRHRTVMGVLNNDSDVLKEFKGRNQNRIGILSGKVAQSDLVNEFADKEVFAKRQHFLSKALFGQKYYTIGQREDGKLYEQQVARQGGLFNKSSKDKKFELKDDNGLSMALQQDAIALKDKVTGGLNNLRLGVLGVGSNLKGKFLDSRIFSSLTSGLNTFKSGISAVFNPKTYGIKNINKLIRNIKTKTPKLSNKLTDSISGVMDTVKGIILPKNLPQRAFGRIKVGLGNMKDNLISIGKYVGQDLIKLGHHTKELIQGNSIFKKVTSNGVFQKVSGAFSKLGHGIGSVLGTVAKKTYGVASSIGSKFKDTRVFSGLSKAFTFLGDKTVQFVNALKNGLIKVGKTIGTKTKNVALGALKKIGNAGLSIGHKIGGFGSSLGRKVKSIGSFIGKSIPPSFNPSSLIAGMRMGVGSAKNHLGNAKNYMSGVATSFKQDTKVGRGMTALGGIIANSSTGKYVSSKFSGMKQGFSNLAENSKTSITSRLPSFMPHIGGTGKVAKIGAGAIRGAGAIGKGIGKGAMSGMRMAGRGISVVGRGAKNLGLGAMGLMGGAMRMIPQVAMIGMIGGAVVGGIKNRGANLSDKDRNRLASKRGLKKNDNLGLGLAKISDDLGKFDFSKFWAGFKKSSRQMIPIFKDIFKDIVRIGKESFPILFREAKNLAKSVIKEIPNILKSIPPALSSIFEKVKPIAGEVWTFFKEKMNQFISEGLPNLSEGFKRVCSWVAENGIPLIVKGFVGLLDFVGTTVVPAILEGFGRFVDWVIGSGIPSIIEGFGTLLGSIIDHLPEILSAIIGLCGNILIEVAKLGLDVLGKIPGWVASIGSSIMSGIGTALSGLGGLLSSIFQRALSGALSLLPDVIETPIRNMLGVHHGGLYLSPDEHPAIVQEGETILPKGKAERLDAMLEGRAYWQQREKEKARPAVLLKNNNNNKDNAKQKPTIMDNSSHITIENVEVKVVADKLSKSDARKQALQILDEIKRIQKENELRNSTKKKTPVLV